MKKYSGQSLAIVMVLVLVGAVIAFAVYSRLSSPKIVEQRASSEANELTEAIIGLLSTSEYDNLREGEVLDVLGCSLEDLYEPNGCAASNLSLGDIEDFFSHLGLENLDLSSFGIDFLEDDEYCLSELVLRYRLAHEGVMINTDEVYSILVKDVDWSSCHVDFVMENKDAKGFLMSTLYSSYDLDGNITGYKDYDMSDTQGFLYDYSEEENWEEYSSGTEVLTFSQTELPVYKGGDVLREVRFKSLGGVSSLRWESVGEGCELKEHIFVLVGATCGGKYVGKYFVIPGDSFAPAVFDYVLFNGQGELRPI